jgi:hypothetical protein
MFDALQYLAKVTNKHCPKKMQHFIQVQIFVTIGL